MSEALKILGQSTPTANVLTDLYTVPSSFSAVVSSITICNQNSSATINFSVSIAQGGAVDAPEQYIYFDLPLLPNDTFIATIGISLAMNDVVRIKSDTTNVSFNLLGVEVGAYPPPPQNLAGGDLDGYYPNPSVIAINGVDVLGPAADGYVLTATSTTTAAWLPGGGGGSGFLPITFRPGDTTHSNIFGTELDFNNAVNSQAGPVATYVDLSISSSPYIPSGNLNFGNYVFGFPSGQSFPAIFTSFGIDPILEMTNLNIVSTQASGDTFTSPPHSLVMYEASAFYRNGGDGYMFSVPNAIPFGGVVLNMHDNSFIGDGTNPIIHVLTGGNFDINLYDSAELEAGAVLVDLGGSVSITIYSDGALLDPSYYNLPGVSVFFAQLNPGRSAAPVLFNTLTPANLVPNLQSNRYINQSVIDSSKQGIVNLSSDTSTTSPGATGNFATISGGDQNVASADYSTVGGGLTNTANGAGATVVGGENCLAGSFSVVGGNGCTANSTGSVAFGVLTTASPNSSIALGYHTTAARNGQFAFSSSAGNVTGGVGSAAVGDAQNGNMVYSAQQPSAGANTTFQLTDGLSGAEFALTSDFYYSISIRIMAYASNAAVGPINYLWEVGAYVVAGVATLAGTPVQLIPTLNDPNATGWTTSITVSGTDNILHVNVDSGTDATSIINAVADIRWVEVKAFTQ